MTGGRPPRWRRRLAGAADAAPVALLAVIAGAGSFTHIRNTAAEHGQRGPMSWAVAVCIDLTCVMAARERQRDKRLGTAARRLSWPAAVLAGGAGLSLAANLAQAQPSAWGRVTAAVPCGAFLVAVSMIERRAARTAPGPGAPGPPSPPPDVPDGTVPSAAGGVPGGDGGAGPSPGPSPPGEVPSPPPDVPDEALLAAARRAAADHQAEHGRPISRDALRARLGVSNQAASGLLRQLRGGTGAAAPAAAHPGAGRDGTPPARAPPAGSRAGRHRAARPGPPAPAAELDRVPAGTLRCTGAPGRSPPGRLRRLAQRPAAGGAGTPARLPPHRVGSGARSRPPRPLFRSAGQSGFLSLFPLTPEPPRTGEFAATAAGNHSCGLPDCFTGKPVKQLIAPGRPRVQVSLNPRPGSALPARPAGLPRRPCAPARPPSPRVRPGRRGGPRVRPCASRGGGRGEGARAAL